jgi:hypothetical protein
MPPEVRVRVFAQDRELRSWLLDELALISPTVEIQTSDTLHALDIQAELWIVGVELLTVADAAYLCELVDHRTAPVIAIGPLTSQLAAARFVCVLDASLTSKQLKRAVRESLQWNKAPSLST